MYDQVAQNKRRSYVLILGFVGLVLAVGAALNLLVGGGPVFMVIALLVALIVALPLSMAIAVASGVSPERGLYAAIVGGFLVSALGGSRFQVGGPAVLQGSQDLGGRADGSRHYESPFSGHGATPA